MILFDFFFHRVYFFLNKKLKRGKEDAKHSALCILVVYFSFFTATIACIVGIIYDNNVSRSFLTDGFLITLIIAVICYIILRIRYYRIRDVEDIEQNIMQLTSVQYQLSRYITCFLLIMVPVSFYIFFRWYYYGYV